MFWFPYSFDDFEKKKLTQSKTKQWTTVVYTRIQNKLWLEISIDTQNG